MRIALVTQNEPFYVPPLLDAVARARGRDIVALIVLPAFNESLWATARRIYALYGARDFLAIGVRLACARVMEAVARVRPIGGPWSVPDVARRHGIALYRPTNINEPAFVHVLANEIKAEVIVSVNASQVFKSQVLRLPKYGCLNVHSSPLPRYRGMLPTFWVLLHGERETAVTVHYMTEKLDDGDIIAQVPVPIAPDDTLESLIRKTKRAGAEALLSALSAIETGTVSRRPNDRAQATYFGFPTREDARRFRATGRRLR